jgi:hypothetical protein
MPIGTAIEGNVDGDRIAVAVEADGTVHIARTPAADRERGTAIMLTPAQWDFVAEHVDGWRRANGHLRLEAE